MDRSRNVSTAPRRVPSSARRTALLTLMGTERPFFVRIRAGRSMTSCCVSSVSRMGHACSHRSQWKMSEHRRPSARSALTPVMRSAARLNDVTRQSQSTVKTPSATHRRTVSKNCASSTDPGVGISCSTMPGGREGSLAGRDTTSAESYNK